MIRTVAFTAAIAGTVLATIVAGCLGTPSFVCHTDLQCGTDASCEVDGHCSAHDATCPSRRRYLAAAGDRSGACVATTCAQDPILALATGTAHACVLRQDGAITCWGRNADGQLGDGTRTPRSSGVRVPGIQDAIGVAAGDRHTCAVRGGGDVVCWGADDTGQLGDGGGADRLSPAAVPGVSNAVAVAAGAGFSCALLANQTAVCWGDDRDGEIGDGATSSTPRAPTPVATLSGARTLDAHWQHACAILDDQSLVCWGNNATGQLGDGTLVNRPQPSPVVGLQGVKTVATGLSHSCAISAAGLSCWGSNSQGQLGATTGSSTTPVSAPMPVPLATNVTAVAAGAQHTCAIRNTGQVLCWGQNGTGQLGEGSMSSLGEPVPVTGLDTGSRVAAGATFSCAATTDGAVFCWGDDHDGELGTGRGVVQPAPVSPGLPLFVATTGGGHTCGVTTEASTGGGLGYACWGADQAGQLGDNDTSDRARPVPLAVPLDAAGAIAAGALHTCAVDTAGALWCWGRGTSGQIGPGRRVDTPFPIGVPLPAGFQVAETVAAGDAHTCASVMDAGGARALVCFGANDRGQLGDGTTTSRPAPALVALGGAAATDAFATGGAHTCAIDATGRLWCWGRGDRGQLGTGVAADQSSPVLVPLPGGATPRSVTAGEAHTCAVDTASHLYCWGANDRGQLGTGAAGADVPAPMAVAGLPGPVFLGSAGGAHSCASLDDDRIFCWGGNESGQLGDGATVDRASPRQVTGVTGTARAGQAHTCASPRLTQGPSRCWGADTSGQLGDGATLTISAPQLARLNCD